MSMARSLPKYQFCVMFSVDTTSAVLLGYTCRPVQGWSMQRAWSSSPCCPIGGHDCAARLTGAAQRRGAGSGAVRAARACWVGALAKS